MTSQELKRGSETVQKWDYGYGQIDSNGDLDTSQNNGQLARIESYIGTNKQWTQKFKYDSIGRLAEAAEYKGTNNALTYKQKFDFDRFGNLYRKTASNPTSGQENPLAYTPIEDSEIDKNTNRFTSSSGTTYDEAGQVVTDNKFRLTNYGYDANGRMVKATRTSVPDALSVYDALGNRVATKVNDVWQFVIYDAFGNLIAEYGGMTPSDEGGIKFILSDWQGSVRAVLNNTGFVQSRTDYTTFGEEIQSGVGLRTNQQGFGSGINTRQGYGSTEKDDSTGLNHTWFRKNENQAGRWTSLDPYNGSMKIGNPQSFNRYSYVESQPTNFVDPSGLQLIVFVWATNCRVVGEAWDGSAIYDCEWNIHFMNIPDPTEGGGFEGGGGGGAATNNLNDEWKKCVEDVDKLFGEGPKVSDEEWKEYNAQISDFWRLDAIARKGFRDKRFNNQYYTAVGAILGLAGCYAGKAGCVGGVLLGATLGYYASKGDYDVEEDVYNKSAPIALAAIKRQHPDAVKRENWLNQRQTARSKCNKYLKKGRKRVFDPYLYPN